MKLLIVDDQILFRKGLVGLLQAYPDMTVVGEASNVREAVEMACDLHPDLVLMDFGLPDGTGLEASQAILAKRPETDIVFLTVHEQDERLYAAIRAGAKGYLLKNVPPAKLIAFLQGVRRGEPAISLTMTGSILEEFYRLEKSQGKNTLTDVSLTWREMEVLQEMATGSTNQQIAKRLVITENTVKVHVHRILGKLNCKNRNEAVRYARIHHLIKD